MSLMWPRRALRCVCQDLELTLIQFEYKLLLTLAHNYIQKISQLRTTIDLSIFEFEASSPTVKHDKQRFRLIISSIANGYGARRRRRLSGREGIDYLFSE